MKLHEIVSARYGCKFPAKYNKSAIEYYRNNSRNAICSFIFDTMIELNDYTLHRDDIQFMCEVTEVWHELFEAYLYCAYEDIKRNARKPNNLVLILDNEE